MAILIAYKSHFPGPWSIIGKSEQGALGLHNNLEVANRIAG